MALPPLDGATNATEIEPLPCVEVGTAGALGTVAGTADVDAADATPLPATLVASTVQV
jgi:hypothetical protein